MTWCIYKINENLTSVQKERNIEKFFTLLFT